MVSLIDWFTCCLLGFCNTNCLVGVLMVVYYICVCSWRCCFTCEFGCCFCWCHLEIMFGNLGCRWKLLVGLGVVIVDFEFEILLVDAFWDYYLGCLGCLFCLVSFGFDYWSVLIVYICICLTVCGCVDLI